MPSRTIGFEFIESRHRFGRTTMAAFLMFLAVPFLFRYSVAAAEGRVQGRVLTRDEGLAVVDAISGHRTTLHGHRAKPDCSHLVNDIYGVAGFPYLYAKSSDLYRGHQNFVRVKFPQPGDLVVWRGHVGLVTDPREHLFYSSLRSGLDIEDYTSAYWTKHGVPRFYRYRITNDQPYLLAGTKAREGDQRAEASYRTLAMKQSTSDEEGEKSVNDDSTVIARASSADAGISIAPGPSNIGANLPAELLLAVGRDKPTVEQASIAISKMNQSLAATANAETLLRSASPVVIVTDFQVNRLQFKGNRGWAYINVVSSAYLQGGDLEKTVRHTEEHWEILRAKSGWKMLVPSGTVYLSRSDAARIFSQRLARLTTERSSGNSVTDEESSLASLLNSLLNN